MTRTTPELTPLFKLPGRTTGRALGHLCMILRAAGLIHDGYLVRSGFEPGTLRPQSRDLTTRPPRPFYKISETNLKKYLQRKHPTVLQCPPGRLLICHTSYG
ncbi:hypothetical protein AVEN_722-1 [Araneus ventricosus]|uniref:Uncharacterized protein n=1 Tax=Araneus ventricosus TaxID=182803 RepID=A0A4Y2BVL5_ARAVE|nr:hypothetical protein AVEN_722-1 [Araneus ventricosus]